ncbi:universal stress protein [Candidatus Nanohalobium constans]|uniref:universal stress protein n=1 Tax=Candidatus Nanohalobium constans TaxID=2565781 RepID=UPI0021169A63|nr:universal stress protein [Candidatus Nanohalobium constans]
MYRRILVTTDGSDGSLDAVDHARVLAEKFDAELYILYVVDVSAGPQSISDVVVESLREIGFKVTKEIQEELEDEGIQADAFVEYGSPGETILDFADERGVDLIIMSSHGRTGIDRFLLGSVTEKVIRNSKMPVLTVKYQD